MRHAPGQLANGLHLLRLRELDLQVLVLGGVDEVDGQARKLAQGILQPACVKGRHQLASAGTGHAGLHVGGPHGAHDHLRQRRRNLAPVLLGHPLGEGLADQNLGMQPDELQESAVAFGDVALEVEQHDAHRRLVEQPMEADFRSAVAVVRGATGLVLPVGGGKHDGTAVGGPVAAVLGIGLYHPGLEGAGVAAPEGDLGGTTAFRSCSGPGVVAGNEFVEPPGDHFLGPNPQPPGQDQVGEQDAAFAVGGEKADRQQIKEIGQAGLFLTTDGIDFAAGGNVLGPPQGTASGHRADRQAPPFDSAGGAGAGSNGKFGAPPDPGFGVRFEALKRRHRLVASEGPADGIQGFDLAAAAGRGSHMEQAVEGRVGIDEGTIASDDQKAVRSVVGGRAEHPGGRVVGAGRAQGPGQKSKRRQGQAGHREGMNRVGRPRHVEHCRRTGENARQHHPQHWAAKPVRHSVGGIFQAVSGFCHHALRLRSIPSFAEPPFNDFYNSAAPIAQADRPLPGLPGAVGFPAGA